jgi:hypothetical protein
MSESQIEIVSASDYIAIVTGQGPIRMSERKKAWLINALRARAAIAT